MTEQESNQPPPPTDPPPILGYHQPDPPRSKARYVAAAIGGFVAILIAAGVATFAAMEKNNAIPLYITGGLIVVTAAILAAVLERSGCLIGLLLGMVVAGLLIAGCGFAIYPLHIGGP